MKAIVIAALFGIISAEQMFGENENTWAPKDLPAIEQDPKQTEIFNVREKIQNVKKMLGENENTWAPEEKTPTENRVYRLGELVHEFGEKIAEKIPEFHKKDRHHRHHRHQFKRERFGKHMQKKFGENKNTWGPQEPKMLGEDEATFTPKMLGEDEATFTPKMLGEDEATFAPKMLGEDEATFAPKMLGEDEATFAPQEPMMLGQNRNTWGPPANYFEVTGKLNAEAGELNLMVDPQQVIDFMDGLILGLTGKEDLPEITKCLQHADDLADEINDAVSDFMKGDVEDIIKGVGAIGQIIEEIPNDFNDCKSMQGDISRIEAWGKIFENPTKAIEMITQNVIKNLAKIEADAQKIPQDFNNNQWKQAGEDISDIMVEVIGPVPQNATIPIE